VFREGLPGIDLGPVESEAVERSFAGWVVSGGVVGERRNDGEGICQLLEYGWGLARIVPYRVRVSVEAEREVLEASIEGGVRWMV